MYLNFNSLLPYVISIYAKNDCHSFLDAMIVNRKEFPIQALTPDIDTMPMLPYICFTIDFKR